MLKREGQKFANNNGSICKSLRLFWGKIGLNSSFLRTSKHSRKERVLNHKKMKISISASVWTLFPLSIWALALPRPVSQTCPVWWVGPPSIMNLPLPAWRQRNKGIKEKEGKEGNVEFVALFSVRRCRRCYPGKGASIKYVRIREGGESWKSVQSKACIVCYKSADKFAWGEGVSKTQNFAYILYGRPPNLSGSCSTMRSGVGRLLLQCPPHFLLNVPSEQQILGLVALAP